jgi:hypothetical protein
MRQIEENKTLNLHYDNGANSSIINNISSKHD